MIQEGLITLRNFKSSESLMVRQLMFNQREVNKIVELSKFKERKIMSWPSGKFLLLFIGTGQRISFT